MQISHRQAVSQVAGEEDIRWMRRALQLAELGRFTSSPNPKVGAVVVRSSQILGEGWHHVAGEAHAEVRALGQIDESEPLGEATLYCTLEPCAHWGRTPPCANLIVERGIGRVVIGHRDPDPRVSGKGVELLVDHGIEVMEGVLERGCREMNANFLTSIEQGRPRIVLKWAQSLDGFMEPLRAEGQLGSIPLSSSVSRLWVHRWRSECDAILVGRRTAEVDDPGLDVRFWAGNSPIRFLLDPKGVLGNLKMFSAPGRTLRLIDVDARPEIDFDGDVRVEGDLIDALLKRCNELGIRSLLIEGGAHTLSSWIDRGLWDEARIITAPVRLGRGLKAPEIEGVLLDLKRIGPDRLEFLIPRRA